MLFKEQKTNKKKLFGLSSKIKQISKSFKFIRNLAV